MIRSIALILLGLATVVVGFLVALLLALAAYQNAVFSVVPSQGANARSFVAVVALCLSPAVIWLTFLVALRLFRRAATKPVRP
jgi:hypothetical protein